jgi:hypothetical protein
MVLGIRAKPGNAFSEYLKANGEESEVDPQITQITRIRKKGTEVGGRLCEIEKKKAFHPSTLVPTYPGGMDFVFHRAGGAGGVKMDGTKMLSFSECLTYLWDMLE